MMWDLFVYTSYYFAPKGTFVWVEFSFQGRCPWLIYFTPLG